MEFFISERMIRVVSMAIVSHENCGLVYSPMNPKEHSHVKKLAKKIDVSNQSEEGLHQRKGNAKNRFSKCVMSGIETRFKFNLIIKKQ